ncbi:KGK domain-containing protein [Brunnivagina elsteri]|uniref:KGK family protein n=1 Tax=Brunnivagina elsteri CCALA 953 TaxID=987040 RepID=A0A2A2TE99_9CYAN|nr:KGK domain-containing protein [Calothrix elsteri]PAX52062.1 hypothetical protein CK510_21385 [Calothrix elsteri CCALA 953]
MKEIIELGDDDVISMKNINLNLTKQLMSKFSDVKQVAKNYVGNPLLEWISNGTECEVLQINGGGWIKGRISARIAIDFVPDAKEEIIEVEEGDKSVLDDLREQLNKDVPTH